MGKKLYSHSLWAHLAPLNSLWVSFGCHGYPGDSKPRRTVCTGWQQPRRDLHGMKCFLKRQNSSGASRDRGAHKEYFTMFQMSRVRQMRAALANVIFTHGFYKRSFLKRCLTLSGLTRSQSAQSKDWGTTCFSQVRLGIPVVGISLNCPNRRNVSLRGVRANSQITAAISFRRVIQICSLENVSLRLTFPQTLGCAHVEGKKINKKSVCDKVKALATAYQMQTTERQPAS